MAEFPTTDGSRWTPTILIDSDIELSAGFEPVGIEIQTFGMKEILVWCEFDFRNSTAVEMCLLARQKTGGESFQIPHQYTAENGKVILKPLCYRIEDTDAKFIPINVSIGDLTPLIQLSFRAEGGPLLAIAKKISYTMRS